MEKRIRASLFVLFTLLLYATVTMAQDKQHEEILQALSMNPKMLESEKLFEPFNQNKSEINVIVTITPSIESKALAEESQQGENASKSMFVPEGPVFYDLNNESIKTRLQASVSKTMGEYVATLDTEHIKVDRTFSYIFGFSATVDMTGLQQLADDPKVIAVEENRILTPQLRQGLSLINAISARSAYNGSGLSIAICDTGIDTSHPRLGGGSSVFNNKVIGGYDTGDNDSDPRPNPVLGEAHGTACAGIAAGNLGTIGDYIGGVAPGAKLYAVKITQGTGGWASEAAMIAGWEWVVTHKNDNPENPIMIISTSFGGGRYFSTCNDASPTMTSAAANAVAAGITIFVSSGNEGYCDSMKWPACISYVNSVGALYDTNFGDNSPCVSQHSCVPKYVDSFCDSGYSAIDHTAANKVASYSNSASFLTMFAPSNRAYTTDIIGAAGYSADSYTVSFGGTSAACSYAAGAAAVLQHAAKSVTGKYLTPAQVKLYMVQTGINITDSKVAISKPKVNLDKAVNAIKNGTFSSFNWSQIIPAIKAKKDKKPKKPYWGVENRVCQ